MTTSEPQSNGGGASQGHLFTLLPVAHRVSPRVAPVSVSVTLIPGGDGRGSSTWFARYDPGTSSWRTPQPSLISSEAMPSAGSSVSWPRSGSMRSGRCYQRAPLVHHTHVSACSLWPTPLASFGRHGWPKNGVAAGKPRYGQLATANMLGVVRTHGWRPPVPLIEWLMGLPLRWLRPAGTPSFPKSPSTSAG